MNRRRFLTATGTLALTGGSTARRARGQPERRPNILFCISDDQSWVHTGIAGDPTVRTPTFDRVAREGVLFTQAFCSSPSCTPSRGAILTGQDFCRLEQGGNLWSTLPKHFAVYPDLLESAGYVVGCTRKGWGPGDLKPGGWARNPAGPAFKDFDTFFERLPPDKAFCFWFGSTDPHRPYQPGSGVASGKRLEDVRVPPFLPDAPEVRSDILDYHFEIERYDREVGQILDRLERAGRLDDTLVVMTSDNGMPFPRAKTNLYDYGTRMPLAMRWGARGAHGQRIDHLVSFTDFAPTFLQAAGMPIPGDMTGHSLLSMLAPPNLRAVLPVRDRIFVGRERHTTRREGRVGYPMRAVRTTDHLYIRNFAPDRWPAGDPEDFGDIDGGPTKSYMMTHRDDAAVRRLFELGFGKRPAEELYDLRSDPDQLDNVAGKPEQAALLAELRAALEAEMERLDDPRLVGGAERWDTDPYYGREPQ